MGTRKNILSLPIEEVQRLTSAFNTLKENGTYDTFVERHVRAMMDETPPDDPNTQRNVAHRGPSFLPWHRAFLLEIIEALRSVDPLIGDLPYWDWAADQALPGGPTTSPLWTDAYLGPDGDPNNNDRVLTGPFANWRALVYVASTDTFRLRAFTGLVRQLGRTNVTTLPTTTMVNDIVNRVFIYDDAPWDESTRGFRRRNEQLHDRVHGWIAGDMRAATSPNEPTFFLHHCNIDRIWWQWQQLKGIDNYQPGSGGPDGHNLNDTMRHLLTSRTIASVLNIADLGYTYE